jgi:hypothetical protein
MDAFEFYFSFYGLLLGLSVAEVTNGLANAVGSRRSIAIGWLTPLLAIFFLTDVASFWIFAWGARDLIYIDWSPLYLGLIIAVTYYLAAALVFPRNLAEWVSLDDHYWEHKLLVIGGIALANAAVVGLGIALISAPFGDPMFWFWQIVYWGPVIGLMFSKSRRIDIALLAAGIIGYLAHAVIPNSSFGDALVG